MMYHLTPPCSIRCFLLAVLIASSVGVYSPGQDNTEVNFSTQIRPILADKCFKCHGPDAGQRATELRLDDEASVHQLAVQPGNPDASDLIQRIESVDVETVMPPPATKMKLTQSEREILRLWVATGAKFSQHWSFEPLKPIDVPKLADDSPWHASTNPIDAFIGQRLEGANLEPSPQADDVTLVRRLSLDLNGLPPSEVDIDQYVNSADSDRYSQLVDRLLAKPQFGEHWAVAWLDNSRYADTHGYQNDRYRATWPWRDWVIDAYNKNIPYDQFITWQLAGDLIPNATREQILATAFNRLHRQTNEGGSVEEEFRAEYVADRVNTFGAAFLGLTLECAKCHDHKYDPISQREYYQLAAFFNNIDESGLYSHFTDAVPTPTLQLNTSEQAEQIKALREQIAVQAKQLLDFKAPLVAGPPSPIDMFSAEIQGRLRQGQLAHYRFESIADGKVVNAINTESSAKAHDGPQLTAGAVGQGLLLGGENSVTMSEGGHWERNQPFTFCLWIKVPQKFERCVLLHRSRAWTDSASRGYELLIENGRLSAALIHFWPGNAIRIVAKDPLPIDRWCQVTWSYDGSSQANGIKLWLDGQPLESIVVRDHLTQAIKGAESSELTIGQRFRDVGFKNGAVDELRIFDRALSDLECRYLYWQDASPEQVEQKLRSMEEPILAQYREFSSSERQRIEAELFGLRERLSKLSDPIPEIMVMQELSGGRPTFVLRRGQYDAPVERVERGLLTGIYAPSNGERSSLNRLDLARWLTDPQHPLTARVAVNRIWQTLFGRGLVATTEDFGLQGASPTHPRLLDWLSIYYIQSGWDTKGLIKLIVTSNAYRQSSDHRPELVQEDPENLLIARGPAVRLSAESLRDSVLAASGLLVDKIGGPPVKPYQPEGLWEEKSGESYKREEGAGSRRRSIYTFWKRTSPPPMMMTFDASNREVCVVRRQSTMTPLQTLVLLNDPQFLEGARALAERAMLEQIEIAQRLTTVFRRLTSRKPNDQELKVLSDMHASQLSYFAHNPNSSAQFLAIGDHQPDPGLNAVELAALAAVAEGLLSYDEFVMKR